MLGEFCLPSNAYYQWKPDYTLCFGVHTSCSEHSNLSFVYGFMRLIYGLGTMTTNTSKCNVRSKVLCNLTPGDMNCLLSKRNSTRIEIIEIENDLITYLSSIDIYQSANSCRLIRVYVSFQPTLYDLIEEKSRLQ